MISIQDYNNLANISYWVDSNKDAPFHPKKGTILNKNDIKGLSQDYQVLKIHDNEDGNGMQAMAVAPLNKDGSINMSQIVIAYAGTNIDDWLDVKTDVNTVIAGNDWLDISKWWASPNKIDGQTVSAQNFAHDISNEYKQSTITTTGHSLGEFLALFIAAENKWGNIGFNGPDPYNMLSDSAKKWIKNNPGKLSNFRNKKDTIGNFGGNRTGAAIMIDPENSLDAHGLTSWAFKDGKLIIPDTPYNQKALQRQVEILFVAKMYELSLIEKKFKSSGTGISTNEQIYLDDSQALNVIESVGAKFQIAMTNTIKIYQDGITDLQDLWSTSQQQADAVTPDLSYGEMMGALESVSCTKQNIVDTPSIDFQNKMTKATEMNKEFETLIAQIKTSIELLVQSDKQLADQLFA